MSIAADIRQAKAEFEDHVARHGCRPMMAVVADPNGGEVCQERIDLLQAYVASPVSAAARWGKEPDDDRRQREHFERNARPAAT